MNPGVFSVSRTTASSSSPWRSSLVGGLVAYQRTGPAGRPRVHDQGSAHHHPLPGGERRRGGPGSHQPDRDRLPATRPARAGRVGVARAAGRSSRPSSGTATTSTRSPRCGTNCAARSPTSSRSFPPRSAGSRWWSTTSATSTASSWRSPAKGSTYPELRRYAEFLRRELLLVDGRKKVELFGEQQEAVFLEISRQRLARLGINEEQIYSLASGEEHRRRRRPRAGRRRTYRRSIPQGGFRSPEEMLDTRDRLGPHRSATHPARRGRRSSAAIRTRRGGFCGSTASRPSASASRRCRAATSCGWAKASGRSSPS